MYPEDFCVANAALLVRARGCAPFITQVCMTDVNLAASSDCAGQTNIFFYKKAFIKVSQKILLKYIKYLDAMFPKDFCISNAAQLVRVRGCAPFLTEVCMADISLATSKDCTGQNLLFMFNIAQQDSHL